MTRIILERDTAAKCWTGRFYGELTLPMGEVYPLPYTVEADLFQVAYPLHRKYPKAAICNKVDGKVYRISFVA